MMPRFFLLFFFGVGADLCTQLLLHELDVGCIRVVPPRSFADTALLVVKK